MKTCRSSQETRSSGRHLLTGVAALLFTALLLQMACGPGSGQNQRPQLTLDVGAEETYVVGEDVVQIRGTATDPDGDEVTFEVTNKPERAEFQVFDNEALFKWDPITSDVTGGEPHRLNFVVKDAHGARTEQVVDVYIKPGNGVPRFKTPASSLYDVRSEEPLQVDIEVRDDDSSEVEITMDGAPRGARFEQTGPKTGTFEWQPSPSQAESRVHTATFVASDGSNEPVTHKLTVILKKQDPNDDPDPPDEMQSCNEEKMLEHEPIGVQRTLKDYPIEATLNSSVAGKYDSASVLYTTGDPLNNRDEKFKSARLEKSGTTLSGTIPNLELPKGESATVYYVVCALDSDAPADDQDAFICSPNQLYHSFLAYAPDVDGCVDDGSGISDPGSAGAPTSTRWGKYRLCEGAKDVHRLSLKGGETLDVFVTFPFGQPIDLRLLDTQLKPIENQDELIGKSPCAGYAVASLKLNDASAPETTFFLELSADNIPYQITTRRKGDTNGGGMCKPDGQEPNDKVDEAAIILENKTFEELSICPKEDIDVFVLELLDGDELGVDLTFEHARGNIDAMLFAPSDTGDGSGSANAFSMTDNESLTHTAKESGLYHLAVFSDKTENTYAMDVNFVCRDSDRYSDNHSRQKAAVVGVQTYNSMKICGGQSDWYQRQGFKGAAMGATVDIDTGARPRDVTLRAVNADGKEVATATTDSDKLVLDFTPSEGGQYYFEVATDKNIVYSIEFEQK